MKKKTPPVDINKALSELEAIVEKIEDSNLSLDDSLKEFERGIELVRLAQKSLLQAEQKVSKLLEDENGLPETTEFKLEEDPGNIE